MAEPSLAPLDFADLPGWAADQHDAAYRVFLRLAEALSALQVPLRPAAEPSAALLRLCDACQGLDPGLDADAARAFFESRFRPWRVLSGPLAAGQRTGFLTGYYEPVVAGSRVRTAEYAAPILARPPGLPRLPPGTAAEPYRTRAAIEAEAEAGGGMPIVWLRDWAEVFFIHVQGSARVALPDGTLLRLVYDGRNGHAYTSIGQVLVQQGSFAPEDLSLEGVKAWVRAQGQAVDEAGRTLLQRNQSYIFFRAEPAPLEAGPIGGAGVPLTPLRSIAVDRHLWPYGLPFWIEASLPWRRSEPDPFCRLMIAEDTGSAILGAARVDLFFGSGEEAGARAGGIRHPGAFTVLLPRDQNLGEVG